MNKVNESSTYLYASQDLTRFVEGLIYGIVSEQYSNLQECIGDVGLIENDMYLAAKDFEEESFEGMRQGLKEMGNIIRTIPILVKDCKTISADLSNLEKLADVFLNPLQLVWKAGKNLMVNGVDILKRFNLAWSAYKAKNFFDFGKYMGQSLDEIFLKSPAKKKLRDE